MNTSHLLEEITRRYVPTAERGSALSSLLSNLQYAHASLSFDKLGYLHLDAKAHIDKKNRHGADGALLKDILNLIDYYLAQVQANNPLTTTLKENELIRDVPDDEELALYDNIYHSFGRFLMQSAGVDCSAEPTPINIRIFLVLSGLSRKAIYPEKILKYNVG